jgi:DNA-directed RNA polymerase subunit omega
MARVTVEDCLDRVSNRFQLVVLSSRRARHLTRRPDDALVPWDNDKATVVALREIAEGLIDEEYLKKAPKLERFTVARPPLPPIQFDDGADGDEDL